MIRFNVVWPIGEIVSSDNVVFSRMVLPPRKEIVRLLPPASHATVLDDTCEIVSRGDIGYSATWRESFDERGESTSQCVILGPIIFIVRPAA